MLCGCVTGDVDESRTVCRKLFQQSVMEFSKEEKAFLDKAVVRSKGLLKDNFSFFLKKRWKFIKFSEKVCAGFPHTRKDSILLSDRILKYFLKIKNIDKLALLLIHERIHVLQRAYPKRFDTFYTEYWGFIKAKEIQSCFEWELNKMSNPDAMKNPWVMKLGDYYWMRTMIRKGVKEPKMGRDFQSVALRLEKTGDRTFKVAEKGHGDFEKMPRYKSKFFTGKGLDHPNEIFAYSFTHMLEVYFLKTKNETPEIKKFYKSMKRNF